MFCKICGNEINEQAVICPKCGCAVVEKKNLKTKNKNVTAIRAKLFAIFKYVSIALICLSIMFMFFAIFSSYVDVDHYLSLDYNKYSGYKLQGSIYASWWTDFDLSLTCIIFAVLGVLTALFNFILSFIGENKEKRFSSDVIFIISILTMILSTTCIAFSW